MSTTASADEELKIVIVGTGGVGKSSFVNEITQHAMLKQYARTRNTHSISCEHCDGVRRLTLIHCLDGCSFSEQSAEKADYWSNVKCAIIMVDYNSPRTLEDIQKYATKLKRVRAFPNLPIVVVYNKIDLFVPGDTAPPPPETFPIGGFPEIKDHFEISVTHEHMKHRCINVIRFIRYHLLRGGGTKYDMYKDRIAELEYTVSQLQQENARLCAEYEELLAQQNGVGVV